MRPPITARDWAFAAASFIGGIICLVCIDRAAFFVSEIYGLVGIDIATGPLVAVLAVAAALAVVTTAGWLGRGYLVESVRTNKGTSDE